MINGGSLEGNGTVRGSVLVQAGGMLSPGHGPGQLSFANGLALGSGSVLEFDVGTTSDFIDVFSGVLAGSPGVGGITVNLCTASGFGFGEYNLITGVTLIDFDAWDFKLGSAPAGFAYSFSLGNGTLSLNIAATESAIPEPSLASFLAGVAALGLAAFARWVSARSSPNSVESANAKVPCPTACSSRLRIFLNTQGGIEG